MSKKYCMFLSVLFCSVLGVLLVTNLISPSREFSESENRYLQQMPAPTAKTLQNGSFMRDFETYVTDQFVARDAWIGVKSLAERTVGKQENNGIYFGRDGGQTLFSRFKGPDQAKLQRDFGFVDKLTEQAEVPVYFSLIPGKVTVWNTRLPDNAPNGDEMAVIHQAKDITKAHYVDVSDALLAHVREDDPAIFYRTDHHWTSLGAYYAYAALMEGMGITPVPLSDYTRTRVSEEFYGTAFSTSGVRWVKPDAMDIYVPEEGVTVTSYREVNAAGQPVASEGQLYDESYLDKKDKYSMFLGGQQPICVIETQVDGPKLLLLRDSFSDSLAPFLTAHFSEIHLIDPRYYRASVSNYVRENEIDQVLVLYSVANFTTDTNLFVLGS